MSPLNWQNSFGNFRTKLRYVVVIQSFSRTQVYCNSYIRTAFHSNLYNGKQRCAVKCKTFLSLLTPNHYKLFETCTRRECVRSAGLVCSSLLLRFMSMVHSSRGNTSKSSPSSSSIWRYNYCFQGGDDDATPKKKWRFVLLPEVSPSELFARKINSHFRGAIRPRKDFLHGIFIRKVIKWVKWVRNSEYLHSLGKTIKLRNKTASNTNSFRILDGGDAISFSVFAKISFAAR